MFLIACFLLVTGAAWAAPSSPATNLAMACPYAINVQTLPGWNGLVDGDKTSDSAPGCFATGNAPGYPKYAVLDLQGDCTISKVVVYNSVNGNTRTVSLASSADGSNYKKLRDPDFIFAANGAMALTVSFQPRSARYVRVTFVDTWKRGLGGDDCLFLREVEVYGHRSEKIARPDPFALAGHQASFVSNRAVSVFKRYCLDASGDLRMTVVGDSFLAGCDQDTHWAKIAAVELGKLYPEKNVVLSAVGGDESALAYGLDWAKDHRGILAPDLIIVSYGTHAALTGAGLEDFRSKYQALITELLENTNALIVPVTPLPLVSPDTPSAAGYDAIVEQVASAGGLPLLRTAAVLGKIPGDKSLLYLDGTHLSPAGHRAVGGSLADLLR
jgi:lysophospholipase L1-like esterase